MVKLYGDWNGLEVTAIVPTSDCWIALAWAIHRKFPGARLIALGPVK